MWLHPVSVEKWFPWNEKHQSGHSRLRPSNPALSWILHFLNVAFILLCIVQLCVELLLQFFQHVDDTRQVELIHVGFRCLVVARLLSVAQVHHLCVLLSVFFIAHVPEESRHNPSDALPTTTLLRTETLLFFQEAGNLELTPSNFAREPATCPPKVETPSRTFFLNGLGGRESMECGVTRHIFSSNGSRQNGRQGQVVKRSRDTSSHHLALRSMCQRNTFRTQLWCWSGPSRLFRQRGTRNIAGWWTAFARHQRIHDEFQWKSQWGRSSSGACASSRHRPICTSSLVPLDLTVLPSFHHHHLVLVLQWHITIRLSGNRTFCWQLINILDGLFILLILNRLSTFNHERTSDLLELTRKGKLHIHLDLLFKLANGMVHGIELEHLEVSK